MDKISYTKFFSSQLLENKVALVTGGSRGIGKEIALAFASLGAKVIITYAGKKEAADETLALLRAFHDECDAFCFNVSSASDVDSHIKQIEKSLGKIDILVNNAGVSRDGLLMRFKEEDWNTTLDTNLKGAFLCLKAVSLSMMKQRQGKIINISSVVGITGNAGQIAYSASKAGLIGLTKSAALELASRNIQVNCIAPGFIETDMTAALSEETQKNILSQIPQKSMGKPQDVAHVAVFLASSLSNYVTGQTFSVDGGMTMR